MKCTPFLLLFLSVLMPVNIASASEVDDWLDSVFQYDMVATRFVVQYDPEYKKNFDQIYSNAEFAIVANKKVPLRSTVKFNGEETLLNDKLLKFNKLDTEQFQNNGCVLKLSFNLDSAKPITIWEYETKHYNYQSIYLNGQALERTRFNTWSLPISGKMSTQGKVGKNTIIAVTSRSHTKAKPQVLHVLTEAPSIRAKEVGQSLIKIGDEKSKDIIGNALNLLSYYGWLVDGRTLADGFFYYIQSYPSKSDEKEEGKRRWDIGYLARTLSDRLADEAKNIFVKQIRQRAPRWIYNGMYSHSGRIQWRTIHGQVESVARLGDDQDVSDFISFIVDTTKPWIKTEKDKAQIRDAYLHYITYTLRFNSLFATSLELAEKLKDLPGVSSRD